MISTVSRAVWEQSSFWDKYTSIPCEIRKKIRSDDSITKIRVCGRIKFLKMLIAKRENDFTLIRFDNSTDCILQTNTKKYIGQCSCWYLRF